MKQHFKLFIITFLMLLAAPHLMHAQEITFNKVPFPFGSFSGLVGGIAQDKNGYMWVATPGGLYRYDGFRFKIYRNNPSDTNSLSSNHLETVYADSKGIIWIATWANGLDRLDPATGKFTHFKHNPNDPGSLSHDYVRSILEDHEGTLWFATHGGLDKFNAKTEKFKHYRHYENDTNSLSSNIVRALYEDKEGTLWVGTGSVWPGEGDATDGGLNRFNRHTGKFIRYVHDPKNPHSLISNKVRAIFEDSRGVFWVGTAGDGLHTMDRKTGTFERHLYDPSHPEKLSRPPVNEEAGNDHIGFITEDALRNIWIGTIANGINRYDPKTEKTTHYGYKDSSAGFTDNSGWSFCNSKDGILWIGSQEGGLYHVDPFHRNITFVPVGSSVWTFAEDAAKDLWIGTSQGLIFEDSTGVKKQFVYKANNPTSLSNGDVNVIYYDSEKTLWIGTAGGFNRFNAEANNFTRYLNNPKDTNTFGGTGVFAIIDADDDSLWIATGNGIDLMNKHTGSFTHFKNNPADTNSLNSDFSASLLIDKSGNLLVGLIGGGGLDYLNRSTRTFRHLLKNVAVYALLEDSRGTIWAGTDIGLYKTNNINKGFTQFTDPGSGIQLATILSLQEDNQHNIWVSTSQGVFKINPGSNRSTIFSSNYGVNSNSLSLQAGYKAKNGDIYFGNANGYYIFSPEKLVSNPAAPIVMFTNFIIGGKQVTSGERSPLTSQIENAKNISLSYNQNIFSIEFAGIHYSSPENNHHLYMLENYDLTWHEAGTEKTASYFNVPPGKYVFHVKASSSDGVWAEKSIAIMISPPWWRTWWAYSIYALLFITAVYRIHRFQKERIIRAERERTRERELAQAKEIQKAYHELKTTQQQLVHAEKMASLGELTAGIAHEIQNPLNFVNNFSEVNKEMIDEATEEIDKGNINEVKRVLNDIKENEEKINHHGKRADAIVKSMLQHSRQTKGVREPTDINALCDEYLRLSYHGMRAKEKNFNADLKTDFDESIGKINVVPQDIGRVLLNLINNAFYAVSEKQKTADENYKPLVTVATKSPSPLEKGWVEVIVKDNGNGIPQNIVDKIFQPFFTTKPTGEGTGLGLSLSYDIIKAHGGEINVQSKKAEGSEFIIQLPLA